MGVFLCLYVFLVFFSLTLFIFALPYFSFLFYHILLFFFTDACFFWWERKIIGMDLIEKKGVENLRRVGGEETIIKIFCMKKDFQFSTSKILKQKSFLNGYKWKIHQKGGISFFVIPPEVELTVLGNMPVYWELIESMCTVRVLQNVTQKHMGKKFVFFYFKLYTIVKTQRMI